MKTLSKVTTVDTNNLQKGELMHKDFALYNVIFIHVFTSMINVVCENTRIILVFPTASKQSSVRIISFILTTFNH